MLMRGSWISPLCHYACEYMQVSWTTQKWSYCGCSFTLGIQTVRCKRQSNFCAVTVCAFYFLLGCLLCMLFIFVALLNAVMVQMLSTTFFKVHRTPVSLAHISNGCGAYEDGLAEIVLMDIMGAISSLIWDLSISGECVISPIL